MQVSRDGGGGSRTIAQKPWLGKYERKQALSKAGQLNRGRPLAFTIFFVIRSAKIFTAGMCYASRSFSTFHPRMVCSTLAVRGFF
jgi:hypothetical protein